MLRLLRNIFSRRESKERAVIEAKYLGKYKQLIDQKIFFQLIQEYRTGDIIFEPIRKRISELDQENLYEQIDKSETLSHQEKFEAIMGLMMVLDGSFPETYIMSHLETIFGKEFVETIENKREEFKNDIAVKKLVRFVKWKFGGKKKHGYPGT